MGASKKDEGRRAEILGVARRLLEGEGAEALTMARLSAEAGVSRATLYRVVGSRAELLASLDVEEEGGDIEARILAGTRAAFLRVGIEGATVEAIAAEAGVGPATIYRRFGGREGLIQAFMEATRPAAALGGLDLSDALPLEEALTAFALGGLTHLRDHGDLILLFLRELGRKEGPLMDLGVSPGRTLTRLSAFLRARMDAGELTPGDPDVLGLTFLLPLLGQGVLLPRVRGRALGDPDAVARAHVRQFLRGAQPRKEG